MINHHLARWGIVAWIAVGLMGAIVGFIIWGLIGGWLRDLAIWARPFAPFSTALVALLASGIALLSYAQRRNADNRAYEQRREADDRSEWWRRTQAAIDIVTDADRDGRTMGMVLLKWLQHDRKATAEDLEMLREAVEELISDLTTNDPSWGYNDESEQ